MPRVKYDHHYAESDRACGDPFAPFTEFAASLDPGRAVLDLGCGQGRDSLVFARAGHRVRGVDLARVGIDQLRSIAEREGLDLEAEVGDLTAWQPPGTFDVVLLDRVLHMLPSEASRREVLARACAATKPGGALLISEYPKQLPRLRDHFAAAADWSLFRDSGGFVFARREPAPR